MSTTCRLGGSFLENGGGDVSPVSTHRSRGRHGKQQPCPPTLPAPQCSMQNRGSTFGVGGKLRSGTGELAGFPLWFLASQSSVGLPTSPARKGRLPSASSSAEGRGRVGVRSWVGIDGGGGMGMGGGVCCTQGEDEALAWPDDWRIGGAGTLEGGLEGGGWGITGKAEGVLGG